MTRRFGYARVSTGGQSLGLGDQLAALAREGITTTRTVTEVASGADRRPLLDALTRGLRSGDHLVVARLDRLGRSMAQLSDLVADLHARDVVVRSLSDGLSTDTMGGRLMIHILGAAAQYERELLSERTRAALSEAKRRGVKLGRHPRLGDLEVRAIAGQVEAGASVAECARQYHVHPATVWRALHRYAEKTLTGKPAQLPNASHGTNGNGPTTKYLRGPRPA